MLVSMQIEYKITKTNIFQFVKKKKIYIILSN